VLRCPCPVQWIAQSRAVLTWQVGRGPENACLFLRNRRDARTGSAGSGRAHGFLRHKLFGKPYLIFFLRLLLW
jgi:hypothetical protein